MKKLPYYRLWVKDFDTNENVRLLNLPEAGLFLFALNHAWINDGLPEDPDLIRRALKISGNEFRTHWPMVAKCFYPDGQGRLRSKRQEEERSEAISISKRNTENVRKRYEKATTVEESYPSGSTTRARAIESESVSGSGSFLEISKENTNPTPRARVEPRRELPARTSAAGFAEFYDRWVELTRRRTNESDALQAWLSVVDQNAIPAVMACLERYGSSGDVARGAITSPHKWIYDQARDAWKGDWPGPVSEKRNGGGHVAEVMRYLDEN